MSYESELLLGKVKEKDIISYKIMQYLGNSRTYGLKEMKLANILDSRLYNMFLKSIDKESAKRLKAIDALICETIMNIVGDTNWAIDRNGAEMVDNYQNWGDPEFRSCDIHRIKRDDSGFYVEESSNNYDESINRVSNAFLNTNKKSFDDLHRLYFEKESIMRGNYSLRQGLMDYDFPRLISSHLGYYQEKNIRRKLVS